MLCLVVTDDAGASFTAVLSDAATVLLGSSYSDKTYQVMTSHILVRRRVRKAVDIVAAKQTRLPSDTALVA